MIRWPNPNMPGWPLNPERDGWHWLSWQGGEPRALEWDAETCPFGDGRAPGGWRYHDAQRYGASGIKTPYMLESTGWVYLSPVLTPSEADTLRAENARLREALKNLLDRDERYTCQHKETHRGGFLWEICDCCGAKWADDMGGKTEWKDPPEWVAARAALEVKP